jgi:hypothetical protein
MAFDDGLQLACLPVLYSSASLLLALFAVSQWVRRTGLVMFAILAALGFFALAYYLDSLATWRNAELGLRILEAYTRYMYAAFIACLLVGLVWLRSVKCP